MDRLDAMKTFVAVVDCGGFASAARKLQMSPPVVTRAVAGLGIARLLSYPVASHLRSGALKAVLCDFEPAPVPIHVVHHEGRRPTRKGKAFLEMIVAALRAEPSLK